MKTDGFDHAEHIAVFDDADAQLPEPTTHLAGDDKD